MVTIARMAEARVEERCGKCAWVSCGKGHALARCADVEEGVERVRCDGGVSMDDYAGFSLRRGGALSLALAGVPDRIITAVWKLGRAYAVRGELDQAREEVRPIQA